MPPHATRLAVRARRVRLDDEVDVAFLFTFRNGCVRPADSFSFDLGCDSARGFIKRCASAGTGGGTRKSGTQALDSASYAATLDRQTRGHGHAQRVQWCGEGQADLVGVL